MPTSSSVELASILLNGDCLSTFLANNNGSPISSTSKSSLHSSTAKSYLMFGCSGESKFRLLNSCIEKHKQRTDDNGAGYKSKANRHMVDGSALSSPLATSNARNILDGLSIIPGQSFEDSENGIVEGNCDHISYFIVYLSKHSSNQT